MIPIQEIKMFLATGLKMNYSMDDRVFTLTEKLTLNDGKEDYALHHFNILGYCFKPLVRPLSQITEEIEHNGKKIIPINQLFNIANGLNIDKDFNLEISIDKDPEYTTYTSVDTQWRDICYKLEVLDYKSGINFSIGKYLDQYPYNQLELFQKLFEYHFDVFGWLEKGLAEELK